MKFNFDVEKQKIELNPEIKEFLNYYGYDLELGEAETEEKSWRCLEYKLTREFNLVASGSYHENGPVDTTGESVLEHILAFRKDEKYSRQSKELDDVLEQLIQLRRKHRLFKFGEKALDERLGKVMFYRTGWTPEQCDDTKSVIDIALMETYHEEIEMLLREIKEMNKKAVKQSSQVQPEERQ